MKEKKRSQLQLSVQELTVIFFLYKNKFWEICAALYSESQKKKPFSN